MYKNAALFSAYEASGPTSRIIALPSGRSRAIAAAIGATGTLAREVDAEKNYRLMEASTRR